MNAAYLALELYGVTFFHSVSQSRLNVAPYHLHSGVEPMQNDGLLEL